MSPRPPTAAAPGAPSPWSPKGLLRALFRRAESGADVVFTPAGNPFSQLGALGWLMFAIVVVSGIYLYIFFDTGVTRAYQSVEQLTTGQWYAGGVMRSFHRYASDAMVIVVVLHLLREYSLDRLRGAHWFSWVTGVPLVWLVYAAGVTGYWLVWDLLAQYVAIGTTEWLDALPFFGEAIAANFLNSAALSSRFFTLVMFMHIIVPLLLLLVMWIHVQRLTDARTVPARPLIAGTLISLLALALALPATSQAPANLDLVPAVVRLDWFYLAGYPLLDLVPGGWLWLVAGGVTAALAALPWAPPQRLAAARVSLADCNGCGRCAADCPFTAIEMLPRTDGSPYDREAVVAAERCVACGICAGACPTATPFRRATALVPGIELPDDGIAALRERVLATGLAGGARVLVFGCVPRGGLDELAGDGVAVVALPCLGALPPPFVDFVLARGLADGVLLAGCREGGCVYRQGDRWTRDRMERRRDPWLRARVPAARLHLAEAPGGAALRAELAAFRAALATLPARERGNPRAAAGDARA